MIIEIEESKKEEFANALRCAIRFTADRMREGLNQPHPERRDSIWYSQFGHDLEVAKRLRFLLNWFEPSGNPPDGSPS